MVAFERFMVASREPDWSSNYIDYGGLKAVLAESVNRHKLAATMRKRGLVTSASQEFGASMDLSLGTSALGASLASDDMLSKVREKNCLACQLFHPGGASDAFDANRPTIMQHTLVIQSRRWTARWRRW